jgi:hypothetical protein
MRLFLDDVRDPSYVGWFGEDIIVCRTATNAIEILRSGLVVEMSLDHDLGEQKDKLSGYDVACWIEQAIYEGKLFRVPRWSVHSSNPTGAERIRATLISAARFENRK